jgi:prophage regulatory protein
MSQADLSRKAMALKRASTPTARPASTPEETPKASVVPSENTKAIGARAPPPAVRTILRMPQVEAATGLKQSHIYHLISQGQFPRGVKLSSQAVGWFADEVAQWQASRERALGGWCPRDRKRSTSAAA